MLIEDDWPEEFSPPTPTATYSPSSPRRNSFNDIPLNIRQGVADIMHWDLNQEPLDL